MTEPNDMAYPMPVAGNETGVYAGTCAAYFQYGLTKREMFAMAAMQGLCANPNRGSSKDIARLAAQQADDLIDALN